MTKLQAMQPFSKAWWAGVAAGTLALIALIDPRTTSVLVVLVLLAALADQFLRPALPRRPEKFGAAFIAVAAFAVWAMVSAIWSHSPSHSLLKPAFLLLTLAAVWFAIRATSTATRPVAHYIGEGVLTGLLIAFVLVAFEILTRQLITRSLFTAFPSLYANITKHITLAADGSVQSVTIANLNRRMAVLIWFLWPAIMLAIHDPSRVRRLLAYASISFGAATILLYGSHQSSQVALLGGLVAFGIASWFNRTAVIGALAALWSAAVLLVVPISLMTLNADLHKANWLFYSAQHRVVIWGTAAEEVMRAPIIGIGADATRSAMKKAVSEAKAAEQARDFGKFDSGYANHAHNVYLQVWYELGAVGALLLLAVGLFVLRAIATLQAGVQPTAIAMFVTTSLLIGFSYSIWQTWFIAACGLSVAIFAVAIRKRSDQLGLTGEPIPSTADKMAAKTV